MFLAASREFLSEGMDLVDALGELGMTVTKKLFKIFGTLDRGLV